MKKHNSSKAKSAHSHKSERRGQVKRAARPKVAAAAGSRQLVREGSKLSVVLSMLQRKDGATIEEMAKATRWQSHSVRGALSGTIKKKLGLDLLSEKRGDQRFYRVNASPAG